jgi:uncharacterized integral membrane protein
MKNVPWRLVLLLALLVVVAVFAGFNLDPVSISVGFYVFEDVPLFLSLIVAFFAGALLMLPFALLRRRQKRKPQTPPEQAGGGEPTEEQSS